MRLRHCLLCLALAGSTLNASANGRVPNVGVEATTRPPNVVFFLIDDLGWTDLGCRGSDLYETPHIDKLAQQGMQFTDGYAACTVCSPTRAALVRRRLPGCRHPPPGRRAREKQPS
jgi:hypothetical protein